MGTPPSDRADRARLEERLDPSWHPFLIPELDKPYMQELRAFLASEVAAGQRIYPPASLTFNALKQTSLEGLRLSLNGQDPYINPRQAMGLSFSVPKGIPAPPSLVNIFRELVDDIGCPYPKSGDLTPWAHDEGCLLLNSVLSVRAGQSGSHAGHGWETFTDLIIRTISEQREHVVFFLFGAYAQRKAALIDANRHCVITAPHPSPLSAHRGFFGSKPFSRANAYLVKHGLEPIDWRLP
jgi:uracil-DNA glycosylase